jgi:hypothetical protein
LSDVPGNAWCFRDVPWNEIDPILLRALSLATRPRTARRLAWLADITLAIDQRRGFPGGCRSIAMGRDEILRFLKAIDAEPFEPESLEGGLETTRGPRYPEASRPDSAGGLRRQAHAVATYLPTTRLDGLAHQAGSQGSTPPGDAARPSRSY